MVSRDKTLGRTLDPTSATLTGLGVDHNGHPIPLFPAGFPFGGPGHHGPPFSPDATSDAGFGRDEHGHDHGLGGRPGRGHGCRGHGRHRHGHGRRHRGNDEDEAAAPANQAERVVDGKRGEGSPDTLNEDVPDPAEMTPDEDEQPPPPYGPGQPSHGQPSHGRDRRGRGRCRRGSPRGGGLGRRGGRHSFSVDLPVLNPYYAALCFQAQRHAGQSGDGHAFSPPVDVFNTNVAYVVHVALPGARKEDIDVTWNPDAGSLDVAGVVHRPGDEAFLDTLVAGERRIGAFERSIALPPPRADEKQDVDGFHISAKMEDGVLYVVLPKVEKEWTVIQKVDIE
ncbi:Heat shock protein 16 [Tolypocladium capitatum]|uniref:Heat shock protein 16 n=1 Tax=Tolypocladium capitatum TaxID=45235 RepID=A0A2K3Q585_9HYPO|nr:Heat shock protein 16 [Tolypocladium capitatum]